MAQGASYNALVNDALAIVAKQLLQNKQLTIQETSLHPSTHHTGVQCGARGVPSPRSPHGVRMRLELFDGSQIQRINQGRDTSLANIANSHACRHMHAGVCRELR